MKFRPNTRLILKKNNRALFPGTFLFFTLIMALPLFFACDSSPAEKEVVFSDQEMIAQESLKMAKQTPGMNDLLNGTYLLNGEPRWYPDILKLADGLLVEIFDENWATGREIYELLKDRVVFEDVDQDGIKDAGVVIVKDGGGSGTMYDFFIVVKRGNFIYPIFCSDLGDNIVINDIQAEQHTIVIDMIDHTQTDAHCCPTQKQRRIYKMQGNDILEIIEDYE